MTALTFRYAGIRVVLAQPCAKSARNVVVTRVFPPTMTAHAADWLKES
jgi:hypothetical protein